MERPILIESASKLPGVLNLPDGAAVGVVMVHGWGGYRTGPHRIFVNTSAALAERCIASLRFDLRGRGASLESNRKTDLDGMIDDALAAVAFMRGHPGIERVFLLGICSGGNVTLGAASLDKSLDGIILWSTPLFAPFKTKSQAAQRRNLLLAEYARKLFRSETYLKLIKGKLNLRLIRRIIFGKEQQPASGGRNPKDSRRDIMSDLDGFTGPALFIYGSLDDDAIGAPEFYREWCGEHGVPAVFHTVQGANHSYYSVAWEREVIEHTTNWMESLNGS